MNEFYFFCPCCHHYLPTRVRLRNLRQLAANDPSTRIIACLSHFLRFSPRRKQKDFFSLQLRLYFFVTTYVNYFLTPDETCKESCLCVRMYVCVITCLFVCGIIGSVYVNRTNCGSYCLRAAFFKMILSYICR